MELQSFLRWLPFKNAGQGTLGVGVALSQNMAVVAVVDNAAAKPRVKLCESVAGDGANLWDPLLAKIKQHGLQKQPICFVLNKGQYELQLVEAPSVEASEMREAIRWRLKDFTPYPVEDTIYDLFPLYDSPPPGRPQLLYMTLASRKQLMPLVEFVEKNDFHVRAFDVPEMALRNLLALVTDKKESVALLQLAQEIGHLTIFQNDTLFFSRPLQQGSTSLVNGRETGPDELLLEIQRSFDFYETRFVQRPVGHLWVFTESQLSAEVVDKVQARLSAKVELFDLSVLFEEGGLVTMDDDCAVYALGAALRSNPKLER